MFNLINKLKKVHILSLFCIFIVIILSLIIVLIYKQKEAKQTSENSYNMSFFELIEYVKNVEAYLAKSLIISTPEHGAETLTNIWREANLAQAYLSRLPIQSQELENTQRFLNQVSDYSYSLSRKNINGEELNDDDFKNLKELHSYSVELKDTLNQLSEELNNGNIKWNELEQKGDDVFAQQVSTKSFSSFSNIEENFNRYSGLIYDGAYSEHLLSNEVKGLSGNDINEGEAKEKIRYFINNVDIKEINYLGEIENQNIQQYRYEVITNNNDNINISISKKGGQIVYLNSNRTVNNENITQEEANKIGLDYLINHGFDSLKETYYLKEEGIVTVNYAYIQDNVIVYPDLIKVKIALDNGEILGIETMGYINNHTKRKINNKKISIEDARKILNKDLEVISEGVAIIPTEYKTEILCYEFKGKVEDRDFLVYINVENGKEEDVLMIVNTPNGTLTM